LGCLRAGIQFICFEVLFGTVWLILMVVSGAFNFELISDFQNEWMVSLFCLPVVIIALLCTLIETNRPPFDLSEAESDIVAGYNVEFGGFLFGLFYLGEYTSLFALCTFVIIFFCGG
jgi:NADH-quinone oxidoreductase subunit H